MKAKSTSLQLLLESKEEYTRQFCQLCKGLFQQGFVSMFASVKEKNKQSRMILREFQGVLRVIPQWSALIIEKEEERFRSVTRCEWLQELLKGIYVVNIQILTHLSNGSSRDDSKLKVEVPSLRTFIHQCYLSMARVFWKQPFLFLHANRVEQQKNMLEIDGIIDKCIRETIRQSLPFKDLLNTFLGGTDEAASSNESESSESSESESDESDESDESASDDEIDGDEVVAGGALEAPSLTPEEEEGELPGAVAPEELDYSYALSNVDVGETLADDGQVLAHDALSDGDDGETLAHDALSDGDDAGETHDAVSDGETHDPAGVEQDSLKAPSEEGPDASFDGEAPYEAEPSSGEIASTDAEVEQASAILEEEDAITYEVFPPSGGLFAAKTPGEFESVVVPPFDEGGVTVAKLDYDGTELHDDVVEAKANAEDDAEPTAPAHDAEIKEIFIEDGGKRRRHASGSDARNALKKFLGIDQISGGSHNDIPKLKKLLLQRFVEA